MAQSNSTLNPTPSEPAVKRTHSPQAETKTVTGRFYTRGNGSPPSTIVVDGVAYGRDREQEQAMALCRRDDAEAELMDFLPEADRQYVQTLLLKADDAHSDYHAALRDGIETNLVEWLPAHKAVINLAFGDEEDDIPINEFVRHMRCTLAPEKSSTQEDAQ